LADDGVLKRLQLGVHRWRECGAGLLEVPSGKPGSSGPHLRA
jgi:hypothetical protein